MASNDESTTKLVVPVASFAGLALLVLLQAVLAVPRAIAAAWRSLRGQAEPAFTPLNSHGDWRNVTGNQFTSPRRHLEVSSLSELRSALSTSGKARAIGAGHSFSDVAVADDVLIGMRKLNRVLELNRALLRPRPESPPLVRVESGISIRELNQALLQRGWALINMGSYDAQTISGAISTATHGSGFELGALCDIVRSMELVVEGGRLVTLEPTHGLTDPALFRERHGAEATLIQDDEQFHAAVVAMGCLGVVYSYVLEVRPRYYLSETRELVAWGELKQRLQSGDFAPHRGPQRGKPARHFEFLINPYRLRSSSDHQCLVTYRVEVTATGKTSRARTRNPLLVILTSSRAFDGIVALALQTFPSMTPWLIGQSLSALADDEFVGESFEVLNLGGANFIPAYSSELAFSSAKPLGDAEPEFIAALEELLSLAQTQARYGRLHTSPVSVRFIKASPHYLAMSYGRDTAIFEIPMLAEVPGGWELLRFYERVLFERFAARPHWGQANFIVGPDRLRAMYDKLDSFVNCYGKLAPGGQFDNSFSERMGLRTLLRLARATREADAKA